MPPCTATPHRDPALWDRPDEFDPGRFAAGVAAALRHPVAFIPFSTGPRSCIGQHFALNEARIILAVLLQRAEWRMAPSYVHAPIQMVTLTPKHGMTLRMWRRRQL